MSGWETNLNTADLICGIRCRSTVVCGVTYVVQAYHMHITCISHAYHTHITCISHAYHMHIKILTNYHVCQMLLPVKEVVSLHFGIANSCLVTVFSLSCLRGTEPLMVPLGCCPKVYHCEVLSPPSMGALKWMFTFKVSLSSAKPTEQLRTAYTVPSFLEGTLPSYCFLQPALHWTRYLLCSSVTPPSHYL